MDHGAYTLTYFSMCADISSWLPHFPDRKPPPAKALWRSFAHPAQIASCWQILTDDGEPEASARPRFLKPMFHRSNWMIEPYMPILRATVLCKTVHFGRLSPSQLAPKLSVLALLVKSRCQFRFVQRVRTLGCVSGVSGQWSQYYNCSGQAFGRPCCEISVRSNVERMVGARFNR